MTITVKIAEAKTHLSKLLAKVEAGEEVVIARGNAPIAGLSAIRRDQRRRRRDPGNHRGAGRRAKTTPEEIIAWRDEGRRF